jgi:excisionase family DNA binding protein
VRDELTPREVAQELGVSVRTVQRWIAAGRLPGTRVGGRMRVSRAALPTVAEAAAVPGLDRPEPGPVPARFSIQALLIANRGEIAARIARTARAQGIRVIRVHEPDEPPPDGGDLAVSIPSYLDGDALIEAARRTGADAIHPG